MIATLERNLDLNLIKKGFWGMTAVLFSIIPLDLYFLLPVQAKAANFATILPALQKPSIRPLDQYDASFQTGGLFGGPANSSGLTVLKASINELVKDYRLKGVVILSEPEAIVEDARTQKSVFVKVGQQLGDLKVKEITEGKIVLSCYGEDAVLQIE